MNITDLSLLADLQAQVTKVAFSLSEDETYSQEKAVLELVAIAKELNGMLDFEKVIKGSTTVPET